jgi:formamidopyrimidine-DNA glycosylase
MIAPAVLGMPPKLISVNVKGKFMWWEFECEGKSAFMMCTYGMSGQWMPVPAADEKHAGFFFGFTSVTGDYRSLSFVDPRHFGTIKFVYNRKEIGRKLKSLGFDPLQVQLDPQKVMDTILSKSSRKLDPICEILMDQRIFAGVGNYIRAEALWRSGLDPWKKAGELDIVSYRHLCDNVTQVMRESLASQGATIRTYATPEGDKGVFEMKVYGRSVDAEGNPVKSQKDSTGRTIHWSPARQK